MINIKNSFFIYFYLFIKVINLDIVIKLNHYNAILYRTVDRDSYFIYDYKNNNIGTQG